MSSTGSLPSYPDPSLQKSRVCSTESQPLTLPTGFCNVREQLHRCLGQSVEVTPERLERLLLTGIGEMLPYETIQTIVSVAYRPEFVPSVGHLSGLVNHTGTIAGLILNDDLVTSAFQAAACDEIFFHQQPILTVVEPDSMAIGAIEKMGDLFRKVSTSVAPALLPISALPRQCHRSASAVREQTLHLPVSRQMRD